MVTGLPAMAGRYASWPDHGPERTPPPAAPAGYG